MSAAEVKMWSRGKRRIVSVPVERDLVELPKAEESPSSSAVARFRERIASEAAPLIARRSELLREISEIDAALRFGATAPLTAGNNPVRAFRTSPVWAALENGPATARELAVSLGRPVAALHTYLSREVRKGTLLTEKTGHQATRYRLSK
jgi:hypothetical protein